MYSDMYSEQDWFDGAKNVWNSVLSQNAGALARVVARKEDTRYVKGLTLEIC
jgi:hypothetical protein